MLKNIFFETGYVTLVYSNNSRVKVPTTEFMTAIEDLAAHTLLATGVHGAGEGEVLVSDADVDGQISTHAEDVDAHHAKYTDDEAVTAMGVKGNSNALNHDRYANSEAVSAMGVKANSNPLNHDRYANSEAVAAVEAEASLTVAEFIGDLTGTADKAVGVNEATPVNAVASVLNTNLAGDNNDLKFTAKTKGVIGDDISVQYVDPGTPSAGLGVPAVVGKDIIVNLATDAGVKASATIGAGANGTVTITDDAIGVQGNSKTDEVVVGTTPSGALAAVINAGAIVVTLGVDAGTKASGTLTAAGVVIDTEIVTLGGDEVYEFDWDNDYTAGRKQVDISAKASIHKAKGTLTLTGLPAHNETFVVDADTHTIKYDTSSAAHSIKIRNAVGAVFAIGRFGVVPLPVDAETLTINGRVYEFDDNSSITGDIAIDIGGLTTVDQVLTAIAGAINGDASAVVTAEAVLASDYVEVTAKLCGTQGNYVVSEACGAGGWMVGYGASGSLVGGANPSVEALVNLIVAEFDGDTCTVTKKDADEVYVEYKQYGSAGTVIVFTEALTNATMDGVGTLGGTTEGTDCSNTDAIAALVAAILAQTAKPVTPTDAGGGAMTMVHNTLPYTVGNTFGTTEGMANGAWGGATLSGGVIPAVDNAKNTATLVAAAVAALEGVTAVASGTGADPLTGAEGQENLTGGAEPAITSIASAVDTAIEGCPTAAALVTVENKAGNDGTGIVTAMAHTHLASGVNGTIGAKGDVKEDTSYFYVAIAANTTADQNWRRVSLGTAY